MKYLPLFFLFVLPSISVAQDARQIIQKADKKVRGNTSQAEMSITTVRPKWKREMKVRMWSKGTEYAMVLVLSPAKDKGVTFLKRKKEVWNWLPSLERVIKLPPSMMSQAWMGTDFTNDDFVKESSMVDDYSHKLLGSETIGDRECYKIEMIPKPDAAVVWSKISVWIDKKDYMQLRSEMFDDDGDLVNTITSSEFKVFGDRLLPSLMEMVPADKAGHKTIMRYQSIQYDKPIEDSFFSTENMKRLK
ncbi:MAG: outer membrane lipoprotein-sorting protein [Saprospiraceae bacterium]|nr:outer membrane lipoprotein-sorting protein [Saprospiraceae bacterium]MCF8248396.1 outer membrane lipoprotein-sorting protein [Saprospiraceae bacterium]MCF8280067.1 outer membrane lipoprotein-sorting protein [Bacteroidales bacterium]MCF8309924.1 outer membrane lipoprotein-sorting protein [Saprospiraceae bacterium]MCF8438745.1 outer membrane lipoprotein-sorting protein [Saprospiraceae bacterium]